MKIQKISKLRVKRAPTAICYANGNMYVATKGLRVFYLPSNEKKFKSILFSSQVNALVSRDDMIFCCCEDGMIYGLNSKHKVCFKTSSDSSKCSDVAFDKKSGDLIVGKYSKKILVFSDNAMLKNTHYIQDTPVVSLDISKEGKIACVSQNNKELTIITPNSKVSKKITVKTGFPEAVKFINDDFIIVGSSGKMLQVFPLGSSNKVQSTAMSAGIISIFILRSGMVLVGLNDGKICLVKIENNYPIVQDEYSAGGLAVDCCEYGNNVAVIVSREPRLGRWGCLKTCENRVEILEIK